MNPDYIKGVDLGNWLVLEKWMNPALFDGTTANTPCRRSSTRPSTRPASRPTAPNTSTNATPPPSNHGG